MEPGEVRFFRPFDENKERFAMEHTDMGQLRDGQRGLVFGIDEAGAMGRRLRDMGLVRGTQVECLHHSPFGDPAAYLIRGAVIALRREDSRRVQIELL